jgi:hypothetical protein
MTHYRMDGRYYSMRGSDENREKSGGISWTTFKRSPNESKNGKILTRLIYIKREVIFKKNTKQFSF